jgi:hypothetical protein
MGYLNKDTVTVDAILTRRGRELLAQGRSAFNITQFAVADDEIDYRLYNTAHPLGTEYYGATIENMPIIEAVPDETQNLRYKLVTFQRSLISRINVIPTIIVSVPGNTIIPDQQVPFTPETKGGTTQFDAEGYILTVFDSSAVSVIGEDVTTATSRIFNPNALPATATSYKVKTFSVVGLPVQTLTTTTLVLEGLETGATTSFQITVAPATT